MDHYKPFSQLISRGHNDLILNFMYFLPFRVSLVKESFNSRERAPFQIVTKTLFNKSDNKIINKSCS